MRKHWEGQVGAGTVAPSTALRGVKCRTPAPVRGPAYRPAVDQPRQGEGTPTEATARSDRAGKLYVRSIKYCRIGKRVRPLFLNFRFLCFPASLLIQMAARASNFTPKQATLQH